MLIRELMNPDVRSCRADDSLETAARLMWDHDCGCVPVVDDQNRVIGIITDRDVCMAALTQAVPLAAGRVATAMAREVECIESDACPALAEAAMQRRQIRRLPVVDTERRLVGIISLADIAHAMESTVTYGADGMTWNALGRTLSAVSQPRGHGPATAMSRASVAPPSSSFVGRIDPLGVSAEGF